MKELIRYLNVMIFKQSNLTTINYTKLPKQVLYYSTKKSKGISTTQKIQDILNSLSKTEISDYINQAEIHHLKPFFKPQTISASNYCFTKDFNVGRDIVEKIKNDIQDKNCILLEGNPGLGLITYFLKKADLDLLHVFDDSNLKVIALNQILKSHRSSLESINIFSGFRFKYSPVLKYITSIKNRTFCLIGVVPNYSFFSDLVYSIASKNFWEDLNKIVLYVVISSAVYNNVLNFDRNYKGKYFVYCMFNFFFKAEKIAEYPKEAFLPPLLNQDKNMFLVKISLRDDIFDKIDKNMFPVYKNFIKIFSRSQYNFVIPSLENWIPGCGPQLISKGILLTTQTRDISASESIKLFKFVSMCEGFENLKVLSEGTALDSEDFE